ncbi:IS4 family transposase [Hydrogenispora ethanolica]|uniref:IS4 family transposase n=1 Tax=Hydrogenispora ethanolica TaxID=1082276 RepID=A0A4R1QKY2_HYDET|nr:IS4 family transposase [Hydrogenispora ethanolica]TCL53361.1 IS4 family transposase [Hydrogenispora ethanolica]
MNIEKTVFAQLLSFIPRYEFDKCVTRYKGNYRVKTFTCWEQFIVMCFAQLTYRDSLRDIETCLHAMQTKLYHVGLRSKIARSTIADANESRDWHIFADFCHFLIGWAEKLYHDDDNFKLELKNAVYAVDSTTIDLCLSLFPWAKFRKNKGAVKLHTQLNLKTLLPKDIEITDGLCHDVNILDRIIFELNSIYVLDRGYVDFQRLYTIHTGKAYFVIRAKKNLRFKRIISNKVDKATGVQCDQIIKLAGTVVSKDYPERIRRVKYRDSQTNQVFVYLTNHFELAPEIIAELYKNRWKIELFFKWIKQHLKIKAFYGTSVNAVFTQIWIAISAYVLVAIVKKLLKLDHSLYTVLQILSVCLFEKTQLNQVFLKSNFNISDPTIDKQLILFDS